MRGRPGRPGSTRACGFLRLRREQVHPSRHDGGRSHPPHLPAVQTLRTRCTFVAQRHPHVRRAARRSRRARARRAPGPPRPAGLHGLPPPARRRRRRCCARRARARCRGCAGRAARAAGCRAIAAAGCPAAGAAFALAWAPLAYDGVARELVQALKFRGALPVARLMAAQLAAGLPPALRGVDAVVPVPPHRGRRRRRGFDPAGVLARALARAAGAAARAVPPPRRRAPAGRRGRARSGATPAGSRCARARRRRDGCCSSTTSTRRARRWTRARGRSPPAGSGWIVAATYARTL